MSFLKAYKTQLSPTTEQKEAFRHWAKVRRGVFNWARSIRKRKWERDGETLSHYDLDKLATQKKKSPGFDHWNDPSRRVLYFATRDVDRAFDRFLSQFQEGGGEGNVGYPKRDYGDTCRFTVYGSDVEVREDAIRFPKIGWVSLKESGYIPADPEKYSEVTVREDCGRWMVSVQAHVESPIDPSRLSEDRPEAIAVHPGVRQWIALGRSSGVEERISLPMERINQLHARVDRTHRKLSRRTQGSNGYRQARRNLAETYRTLRDVRSDATHKATARICYDIRPETLIIQNWNVSQLMERDIEGVPRKIERKIRRRMANANLGEFLRQLEYKSDWAGVDIQEVDTNVFVSQRCADCGYVNEALGGKAVLRCGGCGREVDRETNAIENYFLESGMTA